MFNWDLFKIYCIITLILYIIDSFAAHYSQKAPELRFSRFLLKSWAYFATLILIWLWLGHPDTLPKPFLILFYIFILFFLFHSIYECVKDEKFKDIIYFLKKLNKKYNIYDFLYYVNDKEKYKRKSKYFRNYKPTKAERDFHESKLTDIIAVTILAIGFYIYYIYYF